MFSLINRKIISVKISLFFQKISFRTEFPGSNCLLPLFLTGGKWGFQVANLLLATVNVKIVRSVDSRSKFSGLLCKGNPIL